jgi:hypothetical protein
LSVTSSYEKNGKTRDVYIFKSWIIDLSMNFFIYVFTVFTVFRLMTDFVCLYNYEFWLSLCKIVRSSIILLLPLFAIIKCSTSRLLGITIVWNKMCVVNPL